jgi:hypothetical protein
LWILPGSEWLPGGAGLRGGFRFGMARRVRHAMTAISSHVNKVAKKAATLL